jgi:flagellum-specific peptidoglycan hydrolase FlgJ
MDDFVRDKLEFIGLNSRYKIDINKDTPQTYIDKIVRGGYAQDPNYRRALHDMYLNWINKRWN